jgi:hypothetical protein
MASETASEMESEDAHAAACGLANACATTLPWTVRVPPETRALLRALCARRGVPTWLMLRHLIVCFVRGLPASERRRIVQRSKLLAA